MCHFIAVTELFSLHVSPKWLMFPASFSSHFLLLPPPQNRTLAFPFYGHVCFSKEGPPSRDMSQVFIYLFSTVWWLSFLSRTFLSQEKKNWSVASEITPVRHICSHILWSSRLNVVARAITFGSIWGDRIRRVFCSAKMTPYQKGR